VPEERVGDIWAQLSANDIGIRAIEELLQRYGLDTVEQACKELLDHAERRFRSHVRAMPDGEYESVQWLDNDGVGGDPVEIRLRLTIKGDSIRFDFSGTASQLNTSHNIPPGATLAVIYAVLKSYFDPALPANSGYFRAIEVFLPDGSFLNPIPPAAVAQRAYPCQIISDVVVLALNQATPHLALAGSGPFMGATMSGVDKRVGGYFLDHESWAGALGARHGQDGIDAVRVHHSNAANLPIEVLEGAYPLRVERYELIEDSGGPGQWRGGLGQRRDILIIAPDVEVSMTGNRCRFAASGIQGGMDGRLGHFVRNPERNDAKALATADIFRFKVSSGDVLRIETPGGGGCGDPRKRPRASVINDVVTHKISPAAAVRYYGLSENEAAELVQKRGLPR
jgi:N-methylhydantoinase B